MGKKKGVRKSFASQLLDGIITEDGEIGMRKKKVEKKNPVIEDINRIIHDDNFQELIKPGIDKIAEKFDNPDDKSAFKAATQVKAKPFDIGEHKAEFVDGAHGITLIRKLKGGHINDRKAHKPIYNGDIKNPSTLVIIPFDLGEHKDDKRYVEYPNDGKITRKYKDNCKLTYTRDSAGKAINLKWITYKH